MCLTFVYSFLYKGMFRKEYLKRTQNAGDLSEGPHPFSFRTRQLSLLESMVLEKGE